MENEEVAQLRRLLAESECRRVEADRQRQEADRQREEANRQREEAETLAAAARPQTVPDYLEACHQLSLAIDIVTDKSLTTQGEPTKPAGRKFPRQIIPWDGFAQAQEGTWNQLAADDAFFTDTICPSANQLDYIASLNRPISSEIDLRNFERDTVEIAVQRLLDGVYGNQRLRNNLNMQGTVTFKDHTNLGPDEEAVSESLEALTIQATAPTGAFKRRALGRGNRRADQFCIRRNENGRSDPFLAIEYKAPHKLSRDQIVAGLGREIQPQHDVITAEGKGFEFESKRLCAAVITQLFSYMVGLGTSYGYICTGEVFIFLHIPTENPSIVYYSTQVPNLDVVDDDETRLHRTAVAQVFAFVLRAAREEPPPQSWFDAAEKLGTWAVEYEKMLENVPVSARKPQHETPYKPQRWKGFTRSPIHTRHRAHCLAMGHNPSLQHEDDESDSPSPTPDPAASSTRVTRSSQRANPGGSKEVQRRGTRQRNTRQRQYCTHQCLRGLVLGSAIHKGCPNVLDHGQSHLHLQDFRHRIWKQLATDRGRDSNCMPLGLSGLHGSLFKVCLATYGYTLVAKGVEEVDAGILRHEARIYEELRAIQGIHVPVSLGTLDLALPYYFDGRICTSFLFLSYAGRPLNHMNDTVQPGIVANVSEALTAIHKRGVLHRDAEPRNLLCDGNTIMVVDFEKADICKRPVLEGVSSNANNRKRKRNTEQRAEFQLQELENTRCSVTRILQQRGMACT
ncbi:hypothetical protein Purlil1_13013 [Purpureocillium lilacinum]|uniref:Protein kinase domain-containing protein n=1 Tax=Purpureocillium lilacinum TaxID=33203 RepID=A0ABR0BFA3_PURLI|nr:hypothetical protein Purlil1_13013 [Purpureocillium lilacinum]